MSVGCDTLHDRPSRGSSSSGNLKSQCNRGNGKACYKLGLAFHKGRGVKQNYKKAGKYFYKACKVNFPDGCYSVGLLYMKGNGVVENCEKADDYFNKACKTGHKKACSLMWKCQNKDSEEKEEYDDEEYSSYDEEGDSYEEEEENSEDEEW